MSRSTISTFRVFELFPGSGIGSYLFGVALVAERSRLPCLQFRRLGYRGVVTVTSAKREYSAAQRKTNGVRVFALPGGGFDAFPKGHPVPAGAQVVE